MTTTGLIIVAASIVAIVAMCIIAAKLRLFSLRLGPATAPRTKKKEPAQ